MTINLTKLGQLRDDLDAEWKKLAACNADLKDLLQEMKKAFADDTRFPQYKANITKVIEFNDETIKELSSIRGKAGFLYEQLKKRLQQ